jgi:plastocyanin
MKARFVLTGIAAAAIFATPAAAAAKTSIGGSIAGKVTLNGTPPRARTIDMSKEPNCAKANTAPVTTESVIVRAGGALENVVVFISSGMAGDASTGAPVVLDQSGCRYTPHVVALRIGQQLEIRNSDHTPHNVHLISKENKEWNQSQPPGSGALKAAFAKAEFIPVKCNVHPWMRAYIAVLNTSHFATTGEAGTYVLPNLPPGKYTVTAWQEQYGEQSQTVTISGRETKTLNFVFQAKP